MNSLTREILKTKQMNKHNNRNGVIDTKNEQVFARGEWGRWMSEIGEGN